MRKISWFLVITLAVACNKDDDPSKPTSILGYWTVKTPDNATRVTFNIGQNTDEEYVIEAASVNHNGSDYHSKPVEAGLVVLSANEIESLTILNNEATVPFFVIRFLNISVNEDFTEMEIENSTFNVDGVFRQFPEIVANR